jgi:hypothetical protein
MLTNEKRLCKMQSTYTIDDDQRLQLMPAAEALYHLDDSDNNLSQDIRGVGLDGRWSMSSEVAVQMIWKQFICFLLFLYFLLFSALFITSGDLGTVQLTSVRVFTTYLWRWNFPLCQIHRQVAFELYRSVVGLICSYDCVCSMVV